MASMAQQCIGILRLQEFDTTTPEGRSRERYRRVALTGISAAGAKVVTVATMLIAVPLTLTYLGPERYGLWMTITSVVMMMRVADSGIGLGLMNAVSEAHGRQDRQAAVRYVSSGFFMLAALALLILGGFAVAYPFIPWSWIFNVKSPLAMKEAGPAMAVFLACFAVGLPLGVVQRVQLGYQEGFFNNLWESAGRLLGLVGLLLVIYLQGGLLWLVLAVAGAPVLAWLFNSFLLFGWQRPWLRPRLQNYHGASARQVLHTGLFFFVLQVGVTFTYSSDNVIIAQFLGPEAVTQYAIPYQMFNFGVVIFNVFFGALWPAYGEAIARGDMIWVQKTMNRSLKMIFLLTVIISAILVIFGNKLLYFWVGPTISMSLLFSLGLGLWIIVLTLGTAMSHLLNAANIFKFQIVFIFITLIVSLIVKCILVYHFNIAGIIWGSILAYIFFTIIPYSLFLKNYFRNIIC
jgi:O-antigen/teichoic acid export membrane protein